MEGWESSEHLLSVTLVAFLGTLVASVLQGGLFHPRQLHVQYYYLSPVNENTDRKGHWLW